jgi:hypothetical protein
MRKKWFLLSLLIFSSALWAQEASTTTPTSTPTDPSQVTSYLNSDGTINWQALDEASQNALQIANEAADSADSVQSSLEGLQAQYTLLLSTSKAADQAAQKTIKKATLNEYLWRSGFEIMGFSLAGMLLGNLINPSTSYMDSAFGAGFGLVFSFGHFAIDYW